MTIKYKKVNHQVEKEAAVFDSIRKTDDADPSVYVSIPLVAENTDYQEYLEWVAAGNTAEAAD